MERISASEVPPDDDVVIHTVASFFDQARRSFGHQSQKKMKSRGFNNLSDNYGVALQS